MANHTSHRFLSLMFLVQGSFLRILRVSSASLSLLIRETRFLFSIVREDSVMKELTQFLTAFHKGQLMRLSEVHTHMCLCGRDFQKTPEQYNSR